jgi:hypothetical protein
MESDRILLRQIVDFLEERDHPINVVNVDCTKAHEILPDALALDQELRKGDNVGDIEKDRENQSGVLALLEKRELLNAILKDKEKVQTVFLIAQYSTIQVREKYFPILKPYLSPDVAALMEGQILLENGYRRRYGTQIGYNMLAKYEVRPVEDPVEVNERRKIVGLPPIDEYIKYWNITWEAKAHQDKLF